MADTRFVKLGKDYRTTIGSPCLSYSGFQAALVTWGPVITLVSATIASGTPPPGMTPYVCPGGSSTLYMIGTPNAYGTYTFTIDGLLDNAAHITVDCVWTVQQPDLVGGVGGLCPIISILPAPGDMPRAFRAIPFSKQLSTDYDIATYTPYVFSVASGAVPTGLTLSSSGLLSGTPSVLGSFTFTVLAVAANGCTAAREYMMLVEDATEVNFDDPPQFSGSTIGLSWIETYHVDADGEEKIYLDAPVDLNDPITYYGGYKPPTILSYAEITRALSDARGQLELSEFSWIRTDTDRQIRGWLGKLSQRVFLNRNVILRMIDDASRRLLLRPRVLFRGIIRGFKPRGPLHFEFRAQDFLASTFGSANLQKSIPQEAVTRAVFPSCAPDTIGKPVPIIYGALTDAASSGNPPVLTGTPSRGAFTADDATWAMGWGDLESDAAIPANVIVGTAAAGTLSTDVPNGEYGVVVTALDASGRESDPMPFYFNAANGGRGSFADAGTVPTATPDGTEQITVSWDASALAVSYRVYLGWYYFGFRPTQMIATAALSCAFDNNPPWLDAITVDNVSTGAVPQPFGFFAYYAVSAVMADGETGMSATAFGYSGTHRRPVRLEWIAVPGALSYRIYRRGPAGTWDRRWEITAVDTHFDDDLLDTAAEFINGAPSPTGAVPVLHVGQMADDSGFMWEAFLICGHQVDEISEVYQGGVLVDAGNFGITFLAPGKPGYSSYFAGHTGTPQKMTVAGRDYTMMFVRGPQGVSAMDGSSPLTINVRGRRNEAGDLITQIADIYKDFVINFGFQDSGGAFLDAPLWDEDLSGVPQSQVDEDSFDAVKAVHADRLENGYPGAIMFGANGEFKPLRDTLAQLNLSGDMQSGFNRNSQFFVSIFDGSSLALTAARSYTQINDIVKESFDMNPETDQIENVIVYSYKKRYAQLNGAPAWGFEKLELPDEDAIEELREERRSDVIELFAIRDASTATDIAQRRLIYYKDPPMPVTLTTNLRGLSSELGDVITVSHVEGASASGWELRPLRIMRHKTNPSAYSVEFTAVDVDRLFTGAFILGDETSLASSWLTATDANKRYGYLCDEITRKFSNGNLGKRVR